jgi:hypothetical protein
MNSIRPAWAASQNSSGTPTYINATNAQTVLSMFKMLAANAPNQNQTTTRKPISASPATRKLQFGTAESAWVALQDPALMLAALNASSAAKACRSTRPPMNANLIYDHLSSYWLYPSIFSLSNEEIQNISP